MKTSELIQNLAHDLKPVRPLASPVTRFLRWLLAALFCLGIGLASTGIREDLATRFHEAEFLLTSTLLLVTSVLAAASAFILSVPRLEDPRLARLLPLGTLAAALLFTGSLILTGESPDSSLGLGCARDITLLAALPGAILFWMIRSAAPLRVDWTGGLMTLAVGALGALGAQMTCHNDDPFHLLLWHFVPVLVLGLLGIWLGRILLRWKSP